MTDPNILAALQFYAEHAERRYFRRTCERAAAEIVRLRELVEQLTPPQWADELPSTASFRFTVEPEQWPDASGEMRQIGEVQLFDVGVPSDLEQAADAADEAHARLQAIAHSDETLAVKWGVQYAEMIRNGREER